MTFRVGQKVVCVNSGLSRFTGKPSNLKKGKIYTIARSWIDEGAAHPVVLLAELDPPGACYCFDATRFRPVVERKTDISIFKAMLTPQGVDA